MNFEEAFIQKFQLEGKHRAKELKLEELELEVRLKELEVKQAELNAGKTKRKPCLDCNPT